VIQCIAERSIIDMAFPPWYSVVNMPYFERDADLIPDRDLKGSMRVEEAAVLLDLLVCWALTNVSVADTVHTNASDVTWQIALAPDHGSVPNGAQMVDNMPKGRHEYLLRVVLSLVI
jgi:hypothetical protein